METPLLSIGSQAPDFEAETTEGRIRFHEWIGDKWAVLFSHPKDFTPVCTTELGYLAKIKPEFDWRGVKIISLSVDPVQSHTGWVRDIKETQGFAPNYPLISDTELKVAKLYGMLPAEMPGGSAGRPLSDFQTVRNVFVIGPDKQIKLIMVYPMSTGRNFDEVLRIIDSLQLTAKHQVATPANWRQGEDVIIAGTVSDEDARKKYPNGWRAPKPYLRIVPQPQVTMRALSFITPAARFQRQRRGADAQARDCRAGGRAAAWRACHRHAPRRHACQPGRSRAAASPRGPARSGS